MKVILLLFIQGPYPIVSLSRARCCPEILFWIIGSFVFPPTWYYFTTLSQKVFRKSPSISLKNSWNELEGKQRLNKKKLTQFLCVNGLIYILLILLPPILSCLKEKMEILVLKQIPACKTVKSPNPAHRSMQFKTLLWGGGWYLMSDIKGSPLRIWNSHTCYASGNFHLSYWIYNYLSFWCIFKTLPFIWIHSRSQ